jgi:hypothetical protein
MPTKSSVCRVEWGSVRNSSRFENGQSYYFDDSVESGTSFSTTNSVTTSASIPGWRERIKHGESCTTTLDGSLVTGSGFGTEEAWLTFRKIGAPNPPGLNQFTVRVYGALSRVATVAGVPSVDSDLLDSANNAAKEIFSKRALAAQRAIQSLVTLGEFGETLRMLRSPLASLQSGLRDYLSSLRKRTDRRRNRRNRKRVREIIADTWLEHSFGWQPLVGDIKSLCDALARLNVYSMPRKRINARAGREKQSAYSSVIDRSASPGLQYSITRNAVQTRSAAVRFSGAIKVASGPNFTTDTLGLSLRDIIPSLWELIPYSFLVDYFTNVGSIIDACFLRRSDILWSERGYKLETSTVFSPASVLGHKTSSYEPVSYYIDSIESRISKRVVHREPYTGGFIPSLEFKVPGVNSKKWINIGALLIASRETSRRIARIG